MEDKFEENPFRIEEKKKKKYEAKKRTEEIRELEKKYAGEVHEIESDSTETYSEDSAENRAIQEVIEKIRAKAPEIYDPTRPIYTEAKQNQRPTKTKPAKKEKEAHYGLKAYHQETVLQHMTEPPTHTQQRVQKKAQYDTEQKENIEALIQAAEEIKEEEGLFWKKEQKEDTDKETEGQIEENFLEEYVLKGGWQKAAEKEEETGFLEEDSEEIEIIEEFEKEGAEAAGGGYLTAKKPKQRRKRKEIKKQARNREEEKKKEEEIKRLKNLKKKQFEERLRILRSVSGLSKRQVSKIKIEESYDREETDKILNKLFGEEYYKEEETVRPKIKGSEIEAEEIKQIEKQAERGEIQQDRDRIEEIKKIVQEIKEIGEEYSRLKKKGDFEYVKIESKIDLSVKDIFTTDDKILKRAYPLKAYAPFKKERNN